MTVEEFRKKVIKANWYDKYFYYLLHIALIIGGLFFLYDISNNHAKYDKYGTSFLGYLAFGFLTFLGILGLKLIPNRYKILSVNSILPIDKKKEVISQLIIKLGNPFLNQSDTFFSFSYQRKWWTSSYLVFLNIDISTIYLSVQSKTGGYYRGGIIDFGGTEKLRRKIISLLTEIIDNK